MPRVARGESGRRPNRPDLAGCWKTDALHPRPGRELVRLRGRWIDDSRHLEHTIRRESTESGVLPDQLGIGGDVYTGDLVLGHEALHPLDVGTELPQCGERALRDGR